MNCKYISKYADGFLITKLHSSNTYLYHILLYIVEEIFCFKKATKMIKLKHLLLTRYYLVYL